MGDAPLNPSRLANGQGFPPPNPSRLANGQGLGAPTFHDLQMHKLSPPPPPNPSRLANGWAPQPFKWTRVPPSPNPSPTNGQGFHPPPTLHDLQMDKGCPPPPAQPFTTCKWTRVEPFTTPPPTLHDLQMDKGWGPQSFTTCKWTRVGGPPTLHDLQMDNGWTRVGAPRSCPHYQPAFGQGLDPQPFAIWGGSPYKLYRFNIRFQADQAPCPKIDKVNDRALRPRTYPNANLKFASKPSNA